MEPARTSNPAHSAPLDADFEPPPAAAASPSGSALRRGVGPRPARPPRPAPPAASFTAIRAGNRLCYAVAVRNIAKPVAGGIVRGRAGVLGQENFNLNRPASGDPGAASFCRSALGAQLNRIFLSPTDYYLDVATRLLRSDGSGGTIRGQLAASAPTGGGSTGALFGALSGKSIVAQDGTRGAGDKDAYGSFTAIRDGNTLCFGLTVAALDAPLAANIPSGATGAGGQIVVKLSKIPSSGTAGASAGCITVDASVLSGLFSSPSKYSVNVVDDSRDGAIGGQLRPGG